MLKFKHRWICNQVKSLKPKSTLRSWNAHDELNINSPVPALNETWNCASCNISNWKSNPKNNQIPRKWFEMSLVLKKSEVKKLVAMSLYIWYKFIFLYYTVLCVTQLFEKNNTVIQILCGFVRMIFALKVQMPQIRFCKRILAMEKGIPRGLLAFLSYPQNRCNNKEKQQNIYGGNCSKSFNVKCKCKKENLFSWILKKQKVFPCFSRNIWNCKLYREKQDH